MKNWVRVPAAIEKAGFLLLLVRGRDRQFSGGKNHMQERRGFPGSPHPQSYLKEILTKVMGLEENTIAGGLGPD